MIGNVLAHGADVGMGLDRRVKRDHAISFPRVLHHDDRIGPRRQRRAGRDAGAGARFDPQVGNIARGLFANEAARI